MRLGIGLRIGRAAGGGGSLPDGIDVTIPAQTQLSGDVTGIPVVVDMATLGVPEGVSQDAGNLRAYTSSGAAVPFYVTGVDYRLGTGVGYLKADVSATEDTTYRIAAIDGALYPARDNAVGSDAVFSSYDAAFLPNVGLQNFAGPDTFWNGQASGDPAAYEFVGESPDIFSHQGVSHDRATGDIITVDTQTLYRYAGWSASSMPIVDSHTNAHLSVISLVPALTTLNHLCDGDVDDNGHLWTICNNGSTEAALCQFDTRASGMPLLNAWDVTATHVNGAGTASSGCCIVVRDEIWATSYTDAFRFYRYDKDGNHLGYTNFTNADTGAAITLQDVDGGTFADGKVYLTLESADEITCCDLNGVFPTESTTFSDGVFNRAGSLNTGKVEGITRYGRGWLMITTTGTGQGFLVRIDAPDLGGHVVGLPFVYPGGFESHRWTLAGFDASTFSFIVNHETKRAGTSNMALLVAYDTVSTDSARVTMQDGRYQGLWTPADNWFYADDPRVALSDETYIHTSGRYGLTERSISSNGGTPRTETYTYTATSFPDLVIANNRPAGTAGGEQHKGWIGLVYVSKDQLSDDWLEVDALSTSGSLFSAP